MKLQVNWNTLELYNESKLINQEWSPETQLKSLSLLTLAPRFGRRNRQHIMVGMCRDEGGLLQTTILGHQICESNPVPQFPWCNSFSLMTLYNLCPLLLTQVFWWYTPFNVEGERWFEIFRHYYVVYCERHPCTNKNADSQNPAGLAWLSMTAPKNRIVFLLAGLSIVGFPETLAWLDNTNHIINWHQLTRWWSEHLEGKLLRIGGARPNNNIIRNNNASQ